MNRKMRKEKKKTRKKNQTNIWQKGIASRRIKYVPMKSCRITEMPDGK